MTSARLDKPTSRGWADRARAVLALAVLIATLHSISAVGQEVRPLKVSTRVVTTGKLYVGQAVEVGVEAEGAEGSPEIIPPRTSGADAEVHRLSAGRFLVVPRRPGTLVIPPFRAASGRRSGSSKPTRLTVEAPPLPGRPPAFLGGVGPFELKTEAEPASLDLGQTLEFRIVITGPASWGSERVPDLSGWKSALNGLRVEPLSTRREGVERSTRTFAYRLRPERPGRWILPPVTIAAFAPEARRYATRVASGATIEVKAPPLFDPDRVEFGPREESAEPDAPSPWRYIAMGLGIAVASLAAQVWWLGRRARGAGPTDARALASELARDMVEGLDEAEAARRVVDALATFFERVGGRLPGALTPLETRGEVERLTSDADLAGRAGRLVEDCDRVRFGMDGAVAGRLSARARRILAEMGERADKAGGSEGSGVASGIMKARTRRSKADSPSP